MNETRSIILTILAPTAILLLSQIIQTEPSASSSILGAIKTNESCSILLFSAWSLIFCFCGWMFFVDKKTFGLKKTAAKNVFVPYAIFLASVFISALLLHALLKNGFCL